MTLSMRNLQGRIAVDYMFITDPPVFGDIGTFHIDLNNMTFSIQAHTSFEEKVFSLLLEKLSLDFAPWVLKMDGISDTSDVISSFGTFFLNTLGNRLSSMSRYYKFLPKVQALVNGLIDMIPDEIDIPKTNLFIEGGLSNEFNIVKNSLIEIPLDVSLQNKDFPYPMPNLAQFGKSVADDYQI